MIAPLLNDQSLLFKQYRPGTCGPADDDRLDRLIAFPRRLAAEDLARLRSASCWPVSRVVENGLMVGVLVPRAPDKFSAALCSLTGIGDAKPLAIDWLAKDSRQQAQRGLPATTFEQRIKVCRDIVAVAAILEREGIVYGDWSYANALWSVSDFSGYLIDVDGCSFGPRPWVATPNWEDPLTSPGTPLDANTDRYRVAVMIARCLTGKRDVGDALETVRELSVDAGRPEIGRVLTNAINAHSRLSRPSMEIILQSLADEPADTGAAGNVVGWRPIRVRTNDNRRPAAAVVDHTERPPQRIPSVRTPVRRSAAPSGPEPLSSEAFVLGAAIIVFLLVILVITLMFA